MFELKRRRCTKQSTNLSQYKLTYSTYIHGELHPQAKLIQLIFINGKKENKNLIAFVSASKNSNFEEQSHMARLPNHIFGLCTCLQLPGIYLKPSQFLSKEEGMLFPNSPHLGYFCMETNFYFGSKTNSLLETI